MKVQSLLKKRKKRVIGIVSTATIQECVVLLAEENLGALLVYDTHEKPVGIITERDITHGLAKWGALILNRYVHELMTFKLVTCTSDDNLKDIMNTMIERGFRHLPVVENKKVLGMISMRDLVRERISEMEMETNILRDMAAGALKPN